MVFGKWIVDFIIIGWFALTGSEGYRKGIYKSGLELIGFVWGIFAGLLWFSYPSLFLRRTFGVTPGISNLFSFTIIFMIALLLFYIVFDGLFVATIKNRQRMRGKKWFSYGGMFFEMIKGAIVAGLVAAILTYFPVSGVVKYSVKHSLLGATLAGNTGKMEPRLQRIIGKAMDEGTLFSVAFVKSRTQDRTRPGRPPDKALKIDRSSESTMLKLINEERTRRGMQKLRIDDDLTNIARQHSLEMFKENYFSHSSPKKGSFEKRLQKGGIDYFVAGENLALAPDVYISHEGLMNSPAHKENILNPKFKKIGIGIIDAKIYEQMYTQEFTD